MRRKPRTLSAKTSPTSGLARNAHARRTCSGKRTPRARSRPCGTATGSSISPPRKKARSSCSTSRRIRPRTSTWQPSSRRWCANSLLRCNAGRLRCPRVMRDRKRTKQRRLRAVLLSPPALRFSGGKTPTAGTGYSRIVFRLPAKGPRRRSRSVLARSKRSRFITLFQAATKSWTNFSWASELP